MRRIFCLSLLFMLLSSSFLVFNLADASTSVSGSIASNTTWTTANSPYLLTENVTIPQGVTLTIEPGVTVILNHNLIQVSGTLTARGTSSNRIVFTTGGKIDTNEQIKFELSSAKWNEASGSGCIIEYALFNVTRVYINGGSPKICNSEFVSSPYFAIDVDRGSPLIQDNIFTLSGSHGLSLYWGYAVVSGNIITGANYGIYAGDHAYIANNQITNCFVGASISETAKIEGNVITNCQSAAVIGHSLNSKTLHNYIFNNSIGFSGQGVVEANTFTDNKVSLQNLDKMPLANNNVLNSRQYSVAQKDVATSANVTNNWWRTTDTEAINKTMRSYQGNKIDFVPFLTQPNPTAPANAESAPVPLAPPTPPDTTPKTTTKSSTTNSAPAPTQKPTQHTQPTAKPTPTAQPTPTTHPTPIPTEGSSNRAFTEPSFQLTAKVVLLAIVMASAVLLLFYAVRTSLREKRTASQPKENIGK